jgi:hypothetical protein
MNLVIILTNVHCVDTVLIYCGRFTGCKIESPFRIHVIESQAVNFLIVILLLLYYWQRNEMLKSRTSLAPELQPANLLFCWCRELFSEPVGQGTGRAANSIWRTGEVREWWRYPFALSYVFTSWSSIYSTKCGADKESNHEWSEHLLLLLYQVWIWVSVTAIPSRM